MADEAEEEEGFLRRMQAEVGAGGRHFHPCAEVVVDGVVLPDDPGVGLERKEVVADAVAHGHESVVRAEEVLRERDVDEAPFVGDDVVEDGDHLRVPPDDARGGAEARAEVGDPKLHQQQVRLPPPDGLPGAHPADGIRRIQEGLAGDGVRLVVGGDVLGLARKQKFRILAGKRVGLHVMPLGF